ncbi:somatostatin receptor type 4-like [Tribolium madens]|uniref:somatostatin receptor type 4-like n=1 Tax=Tribolium madens TaxID=41895 RepID=UPI001CF74B49|nr:somatostatin receptor type 4-like [Tribolium madens]
MFFYVCSCLWSVELVLARSYIKCAQHLTMEDSRIYTEAFFFESLTVVSSFSLLANALLIFVILKYRKLREDTSNLIFLLFNILEGVILLCTFFIPKFFDSQNFRLFCTFFLIDISAIFAILIILFLLICDIYIKIYYKNKYKNFGLFCKFVLILTCILTVCAPFFTVPICMSNQYMPLFILFISIGVTAILVLFLIIINIVHAIRKRRLTNYKSSNIGLVVPNIFLLAACSTLILYLCLELLYYIQVAPITYILLLILFVLTFSNPIINLIYVYVYDNDYNVFLKVTFNCRCREYENVNLEDQSVTFNEQNGVLITQS